MRNVAVLFFIFFSSISIAQIKSPDKKPAIVFLTCRVGYGYSPFAIKPSGLFVAADAGIIAKNKFGMASSVQYRIGKIMAGPDYRTIKKLNATEIGATKTFVINNRSVIDVFLQIGIGSYVLEKSLYSNSKILKTQENYYALSSSAIQYATGIRNLELSTGFRYNIPLTTAEPEVSYVLFYVGIGYRGIGKK